jgi:hypothetical protein
VRFLDRKRKIEGLLFLFIASRYLIRFVNPGNQVEEAAVILRFGVQLEHGRRKTTDNRAPPVSDQERARGLSQRSWAGPLGIVRRGTGGGSGPLGAAQAPARESRPSARRLPGKKVNILSFFSFLCLLVFKKYLK